METKKLKGEYVLIKVSGQGGKKRGRPRKISKRRTTGERVGRPRKRGRPRKK